MAFFKTVLRMFKSNFGRFIAVTAIMVVGIALMTGIGEVSSVMKNAGDNYFVVQNVPDLIVKSTSQRGFNDEQLEEISALDYVDSTLAFTAVETDVNELLTRLYFLPLGDQSINKIELIEGRFPENIDEVVAERETNGMKSYEIGDTVTLYGRTMTVTGTTLNPLMFSKEAEPSNTEDVDLDCVLYFDSAYAADNFMFSMLPTTDVYVKLADAMGTHNIFSDRYKDRAAWAAEGIEGLEPEGSTVVLTLEENLSYALFETNAEKILMISFIIPIFFVAVVALVILTTMSRLIEKERPLVGCYKTLGVSNNKIRLKYILFILGCFITGSVIGLIAGSFGIMPLIYSAYTALFALPAVPAGFYLAFGLIAAAIIFVAVFAVSMYVIAIQLREKPANLLKPKSPKPGKKIFLEKVPIIWNRLKFKYKSTMRNIFRNMKNFLMTVISVAGSTALVFAGLGLYDAAGASATTVSSTTGRVADSISLISVVIIICAAALSILVMYNLTNMIIEERRREVATLKVLGYKNIELIGYIFREVVIMALIGIIIGLPLGMLLVNVLFGYVDFGSLADINWYMYLGTFVVSLAFIGMVALMLFKKITRTDMNASLKSVE